jgi:hypothetical protein
MLSKIRSVSESHTKEAHKSHEKAIPTLQNTVSILCSMGESTKAERILEDP